MQRKAFASFIRRLLLLFVFFVVLAIAAVLLYKIYYMVFFASLQTPQESEERNRVLFFGDPQIEGAARIKKQGLYGAFQNIFNDYYMRWVFYRTVTTLNPQMIVVLGDLVSSQYISYEEFQSRVIRLRWIFALPAGYEHVHFVWLAGNHDIGYGSDCTQERMARFEDAFGPQNVSFEFLDQKWLVFNSQVVEGAKMTGLMNQTREFIEDVGNNHLKSSRSPKHTPLIVLDHIPLHKPKGFCGDAPVIRTDEGGFITSQNMLSLQVTHTLLKFGPALVYNGHDHNGCIYSHKMSRGSIQEITVRSIMGDFGGFSVLLEITPDQRNVDPDFQNEFLYDNYMIGFVSTYEFYWIFFTALGWLSFVSASLLLATYRSSKPSSLAKKVKDE